MTLLTAAHLPLLTAKLVELEALSSDILSIGSEAIFQKHYTKENGLDEIAYRKEYDELKIEFKAAWDLNYKNREDVKVAIAECENQISISNALSLIL